MKGVGIMKVTIYGRTGRAQLAVHDHTGENVPISKRREKPEFTVCLLPRSASPHTSFAAAGDPAYYGTDLELALLHIKAWTGLDHVELPQEIQKYAA